MPSRPPHPCSQPGCARLTNERFCEEHKQETDWSRGSAAARGYDTRWRRARERSLAENPYCAECRKVGELVGATVVDHIRPHRGNEALFRDETNWQGLCSTHHQAKSARELNELGARAWSLPRRRRHGT